MSMIHDKDLLKQANVIGNSLSNAWRLGKGTLTALGGGIGHLGSRIAQPVGHSTDYMGLTSGWGEGANRAAKDTGEAVFSGLGDMGTSLGMRGMQATGDYGQRSAVNEQRSQMREGLPSDLKTVHDVSTGVGDAAGQSAMLSGVGRFVGGAAPGAAVAGLPRTANAIQRVGQVGQLAGSLPMLGPTWGSLMTAPGAVMGAESLSDIPSEFYDQHPMVQESRANQQQEAQEAVNKEIYGGWDANPDATQRLREEVASTVVNPNYSPETKEQVVNYLVGLNQMQMSPEQYLQETQLSQAAEPDLPVEDLFPDTQPPAVAQQPAPQPTMDPLPPAANQQHKRGGPIAKTAPETPKPGPGAGTTEAADPSLWAKYGPYAALLGLGGLGAYGMSKYLEPDEDEEEERRRLEMSKNGHDLLVAASGLVKESAGFSPEMEQRLSAAGAKRPGGSTLGGRAPGFAGRPTPGPGGPDVSGIEIPKPGAFLQQGMNSVIGPKPPTQPAQPAQPGGSGGMGGGMLGGMKSLMQDVKPLPATLGAANRMMPPPPPPQPGMRGAGGAGQVQKGPGGPQPFVEPEVDQTPMSQSAYAEPPGPEAQTVTPERQVPGATGPDQQAQQQQEQMQAALAEASGGDPNQAGAIVAGAERIKEDGGEALQATIPAFKPNLEAEVQKQIVEQGGDPNDPNMFQEVMSSIMGFISDNPMAALAIALGLGMSVGGFAGGSNAIGLGGLLTMGAGAAAGMGAFDQFGGPAQGATQPNAGEAAPAPLRQPNPQLAPPNAQAGGPAQPPDPNVVPPGTSYARHRAQQQQPVQPTSGAADQPGAGGSPTGQPAAAPAGSAEQMAQQYGWPMDAGQPGVFDKADAKGVVTSYITGGQAPPNFQQVISAMSPQQKQEMLGELTSGVTKFKLNFAGADAQQRHAQLIQMLQT